MLRRESSHVSHITFLSRHLLFSVETCYHSIYQRSTCERIIHPQTGTRKIPWVFRKPQHWDHLGKNHPSFPIISSFFPLHLFTSLTFYSPTTTASLSHIISSPPPFSHQDLISQHINTWPTKQHQYARDEPWVSPKDQSEEIRFWNGPLLNVLYNHLSHHLLFPLVRRKTPGTRPTTIHTSGLFFCAPRERLTIRLMQLERSFVW